VGWRDLLATKNEVVTLPWTGGLKLHSKTRVFKLDRRPPEFGWYEFTVDKTKAADPKPDEPLHDLLKHHVVGYLVGNRIVADHTIIDPDPAKIADHSETVYLLPEGLDRFARIRAGRIYPEGPLIYVDLEFPLGPEEDVLNAYLDQKESVENIPNVAPALDAAFRMEVYKRHEEKRRREELAKKKAEQEAKRAKEKRRKELLEKLGDGAGRRAMAKESFEEAAKAALAVGGAQYLDHRKVRNNEWAVKYRVDGRRLECVCTSNLQIIDAGVCLIDHDTDEKGDTYFTLESIPAVIRQAIREGKLVVWRHVDD